jgi:hypothetical protein
MERFGHTKVLFMHFPALARNGPPTSFHLTAPKDYDIKKGVAYVILNKFKAESLLSSGMPRPITLAEVIRVMAGVPDCGHPASWVRGEDDAWDADELLDSFEPEAMSKAPKIKLEPNHAFHNEGKLKRALFNHNEMDEDDSVVKAGSDSEIEFGDDDNERYSSESLASSSSSSAMSTTPAAPKVKAAKRLRKNQ